MTNSPRLTLVAAIDTSPSAPLVLHETARLARSMPNVDVHLVHVVESLPVAAATIGGSPLALPSAATLMEEANRMLERQAAALELERGGRVIAHLRVGVPWREIVQLATDLEATTLIIGTHDMKGWQRLLLGSVTEVIVRSAPCPVLVVRAHRSHAADVPEILPPCADCLAARKASDGKTFWCERHTQHHPHAHVYQETPDSFGVGSQSYRD